MKRLTYAFVTLVAALFLLSQVTLAQDTTLVTQWGKTSLGTGWPLIPDTAGAAGIGSGAAPNGWSTIAGHFDTLTATTTQAVVVTGQMVITGGSSGSNYTWMRYALTNQDSATLNYAGTDSAIWVSSKKWYGYEFDPISGAGSMSNTYLSWPQGNQGTVWAVIDGNWYSTNSCGGPPLSQVRNQPRNAPAIAGTYNFALSVESVNDTVNELRWYFVEQNNAYWFGGTIQTMSTTKKFNSLNFGFNSDFGGNTVNFYGVRATYGPAITVPPAPWQAYYVPDWGTTPQGNYWPVTNDSSTLVGNGTIMGSGAINGGGWATIQGGFGQALSLKTDQALNVTGQLVFTGTNGAGSSYTPLRYAIVYQDSSILHNALTDSAYFTGNANSYSGYEFDPRSGAGTIANGTGGQGTFWAVINGNWNSTYSNHGPTLGITYQQTRNAELIPGTYNFDFSIMQLNDTTNIVSWALVEQNNKYWFAGMDTVQSTTNKFNAICFGLNGGDFTQFDVLNAKLDYGPIIIPPRAPWQSFYVGDWGFYGGKQGNWTLTPDIVGNVTISGSSRYNPINGWTVLRGGFGEGNVVTPYTAADSALVITGTMQLTGGGFEAMNSLRLGLSYSPNAGSVDTTTFGADSSYWTGTDTGNFGYLFMPTSGSNSITNWTGISQQGSWGAVVNDSWMSTTGTSDYILGVDRQQPTNAVAGAGTYNFTFVVAPQNNGSQKVSWQLVNSDTTYMIEGSAVDNHNPVVTKGFNGVIFALGTGITTTEMRITNVLVDLKTPPAGIATAIDGNARTLPTSYSLSQNFPNPFNPTTNIQFALPKSGNVSLVVYDILGRQVATLVNENLTAGYHQVTFNASNLASGVYFYRIQAGNFVSVKKLMLLK